MFGLNQLSRSPLETMSSAVEKQKRLLPLFQHVSFSTRDKFVMRVQRDPRLAGLGILGRGVLFSCFHEDHLQEATQLYEVLLTAPTFEEFLDLCHQCRDYVNEGLYAYAVSVALLHRKDCRGVSLPPVQEIFPDKFVPVETLYKAYKETKLHAPEDEVIINIEKTGNIMDPEYNLAYYREDIGINAHHWHWHLVYPATWRSEVIGRIKDRKGEIFFYMHQQMCARYDCERLSNNMPQMVPFHNFDEPLEGYSPHLSSNINGLPYSSRNAGRRLADLPECAVHDLDRWRERILDAIDLGFVVDQNGAETPLDEVHGIDILGNLIESSYDSINAPFYGSLHNWGHVLMAAAHDPDGRFKLNPGVMDDTATSLRDPIFYRWHRFIDDLFQTYKRTLPVYSHEDLEFPGVVVKDLCVRAKTPDVVTTFFKKDVLDVSHAFYFGRTGKVKVRYEHLDHEPFIYKFVVANSGTKTRHAKVRIYLGPKYDHLGNEIKLADLRRLMIELDSFHVELKPGSNTFERRSIDSSVTLSKQKTLAELLKGEGADRRGDEYCSCGWPDHLLVPKGKNVGMKFHLFAILTDYFADTVNDHGRTSECIDAVSYCGAKDQLFPDRRAMGFPFDREITADVKEWLLPNMFDKIISIQHV
ncbi:hemocyanin B chain-like [Stegodyphus dumicola]|uniref:hemocyanin B chain-like n=1 Tax=Stegodyphus dumicola TaxID=202533 RepID=UPI0015AB6D72|nr:hemocyanin B chain-like [Stegodyphus dumicola]